MNYESVSFSFPLFPHVLGKYEAVCIIIVLDVWYFGTVIHT